jgi:hypothetical protein
MATIRSLYSGKAEKGIDSNYGWVFSWRTIVLDTSLVVLTQCVPQC